MNNIAYLKIDSPFYPVFEDGAAPITNVLMPQSGDMQGVGLQDFYSLDVARCSDQQVETIARMVAAQCGSTPDEVKRDMMQRKMIPLRAAHVQGIGGISLRYFT